MVFTHSKIRLHKLVSDLVKQQNLEYTNPEIQKNIGNFGVLVDNVLIKNRLEWVYFEQKISLETWPNRELTDFTEVKILKETKDYLLINKPTAVVVESGVGHKHDNLINWLEQKFGQKLFLVHRIDKDTQGLLLVAKNETNLDFFQDQFRDRKVIKKYLAVVENIVENLYEIDNWQVRDKHNALRQKFFWSEIEAKAYNPKARNAKSLIKPIRTCKELNLSLIEIQIFTGRTHQIRLQCESLGFLVQNDKVYNQKINLQNNLKNNSSNFKKTISSPILDLEKKDFLELKTQIFGKTNFCLISNFLQILDLDKKMLEFQLHEI